MQYQGVSPLVVIRISNSLKKPSIALVISRKKCSRNSRFWTGRNEILPKCTLHSGLDSRANYFIHNFTISLCSFVFFLLKKINIDNVRISPRFLQHVPRNCKPSLRTNHLAFGPTITILVGLYISLPSPVTSYVSFVYLLYVGGRE